jgi:DNA-binding MarR family transcriptional regulator
VTRQIGICLEERLAGLGAGKDGHVLAYLLSYAPATVGELARVFGHPPSTLTSLLDRLDAKGLVHRSLNPDDRRSFLVSLEPRGRALGQEVRALIEAFEGEVARRVSAADVQGFHAVVRAIGEVTRVELPQRAHATVGTASNRTPRTEP